MALNFIETELPGVMIVEPQVFPDDRGLFFETYHVEKYKVGGFEKSFVQDNFSQSTKGVLRGLHYQIERPQGKLVSCLSGEIFDVAVDIRKNSDTFGKWFGVTLSEKNRKQLYVPEGFAHGFCAMSETANVVYKCTDVYIPEYDRGLLWSEPEFSIDWPLESPLLSKKDAVLPKLSEVPNNDLPTS